MSEPTQKCENNTISRQNYTQKLFIEMAYSCCFTLGENLDFLQKSFITSTAEHCTNFSSKREATS